MSLSLLLQVWTWAGRVDDTSLCLFWGTSPKICSRQCPCITQFTFIGFYEPKYYLKPHMLTWNPKPLSKICHNFNRTLLWSNHFHFFPRFLTCLQIWDISPFECTTRKSRRYVKYEEIPNPYVHILRKRKTCREAICTGLYVDEKEMTQRLTAVLGRTLLGGGGVSIGQCDSGFWASQRNTDLTTGPGKVTPSRQVWPEGHNEELSRVAAMAARHCICSWRH
jgi:hypothetical protein